MIKTKIVATLGPASCNEQTISAFVDHGVDIFRLNFSHGDLSSHKRTLDVINKVREKHVHSLAVMGDLCGPKIRTSLIEPEGEILKEGEEIIITPAIEKGSPRHFGTNYQPFCKDVEVGERILVDDGQIALKVVKKSDTEVTCQVIIGGAILSHKGINLPDSRISAPAITERDWECVDWAMENNLDYLALSFVRTAEEIKELKADLRYKDSRIRVVSKIEKPEAVENLEDIIKISDAVLVARGDLGVEMELAQVPLIQKRITRMCRQLGKPVIVATQMLQSMIENATPTRAEVSDIANAILEYTDAVMLSGETAVGKHPLEALQTITDIARNTEAYQESLGERRPIIAGQDELAVIAAISRSVAQLLDELDIKLLATWSQTGATARYLSKTRIDVPILAYSTDRLACRQMNLHYGVIPIRVEQPENLQVFTHMVDRYVLNNHWAKPGDQVLLLPGRSFTNPTTAHAILIHNIANR